uniref:Uncharacterized protein n=1 Tax=Glossina austeni TaxID=7395 RepID=A0A1A9UF40_GLOAU
MLNSYYAKASMAYNYSCGLYGQWLLIRLMVNQVSNYLLMRLADWLAEWLDGWMDGWLAAWLDGWMAGWLAGWMSGWLSGWLDGWLSDCRPDCLAWFDSSFIYMCAHKHHRDARSISYSYMV